MEEFLDRLDQGNPPGYGELKDFINMMRKERTAMVQSLPQFGTLCKMMRDKAIEELK